MKRLLLLLVLLTARQSFAATFGHSTPGATAEFTSAPVFCKFTTPAEGGTITSIRVWTSTAVACTMGTAIYSDNAGVPNLKLAEDSGNVSISTGAAAWYSTNISYTFPANTVLWLALWSNNSAGEQAYYYDAGGIDQTYTRFGQTFETWPSLDFHGTAND